MKEKLIIFLLIFSLTVNVAALITMGYFWRSDYSSKGDVLRKGVKAPRLGRELSLNNGQWRKMRGMRRSLLNEIDPIRDELTAKREELVNLLTIEEPDRSAINQKLGEINGLQLQTQRAVIDHLLREKEFLTPGQQRQYFDFMSKRICRKQFFMGSGSRSMRGPGMRREEGGMGLRDGSGKGRGQGQGIGRGDGSGRGQGMGNGSGRGQGRRMR